MKTYFCIINLYDMSCRAEETSQL